MQQVVNFQAIWIGWTIEDLSCMFPTEQSRICLVCLLPFLLTSQHYQRSKCWDVAICWKPFFHFYATWHERRKRFQNIQKDNLNMASLLFSMRLSHRKFCRCRPPEVGLFACFLCWTNKQILLSNNRLLAFPFLLLLPLSCDLFFDVVFPGATTNNMPPPRFARKLCTAVISPIDSIMTSLLQQQTCYYLLFQTP